MMEQAGKKGVFISFEGGEGCGKSTQIARLERRLLACGRSVLRVREPGGTVLGERIRELLQHAPEGAGMAAEAELLLFAASRAQLVREKIRPALERGVVVLADRFLDSTTVYQGVARGLDRAAVEAINRFAVGRCLPDLTLLLDVPIEVGASRMSGRGAERDRIEREAAEFFVRVRDGYLALAEAEPGRIVVVDGSGLEDEVAETVGRHLEERIHGLFD